MNIIIGISYYLPNISGLTMYAAHLSESLAKKGHTVTVLTAHHDKKLPTTEVINSVTVKRLWTPFLFGRGPIMPLYIFQILSHVKNADLVNFHIPSFEVVFAVLLAKLFRKRVVLTHHCDLSQWPGFINKISEKAVYFSLLVSGYLADIIVVYTKDYADHSLYLKKFRKKLIYCLPPVTAKKPKGVLSLNKSDYKIGFAGRIGREKGIEYLINTVPYLKKLTNNSFKIYLAGPSNEVIGGGYHKELEKLFSKHSNNVELLGALNQEEMADFYSQMDVLVLPSIENLESFGLVQVEAMYLGCPVVASNLPGVRVPTTLTGMGITVPIKNCKALATGIHDILQNKKKYVKSEKIINSIFNYKNTIKTYEKLFQNLLAK